MNPFENHPLTAQGGGQHSLNQAIALEQLRYFCLTKYKRPIGALRQQQRIYVVFVLLYVVCLERSAIPPIVNVSRVTLWKDIDTACLYFDKMPAFRAEVERIYNYLLLFARKTL